jgi:hypothetical protein
MKLTKNIRRLLGFKRPPLPSHQMQANILALPRNFSPQTAIGYSKIRVGRDGDGCYVMVDDFKDITAAFSFGIGNDASRDLAIGGCTPGWAA